MLNHYGKFFSLRDAVTDTAQKFGVKESTLYMDWHRRARWIRVVGGFKDRTAAIDLLIQKQFGLLKDLEILKFQADNDNAKIGAARTQAEITSSLIQLLRELHKEDGFLEGSDELKISWLYPNQNIHRVSALEMVDVDVSLLTEEEQQILDEASAIMKKARVKREDLH